MLVLSRKIGEKIVIDSDITITVVEVQGNRVKLGIEAPAHISILRSELQGALSDRSASSRLHALT